jgi:hypothetical protein
MFFLSDSQQKEKNISFYCSQLYTNVGSFFYKSIICKNLNSLSSNFCIHGPSMVWPKNTIFAVYSKKFRKFPILLKIGIWTPTPWGYCGRHCENVCKFFFAKFGFRVKKHDFRENPIRFLQNSLDYIPKIGFREKLFFTIFAIFPQLYNFRKIIFFCNSTIFAK